jgi:pimeloyl-ACP methyl ester carboxylesterase
MTLVYIHGASATGESFNYIRDRIPGKSIVVNYNSADGFEHNLKDMQAALKDIEDIFFIAHSLGGIYALHLANALPNQVIGAVTLSTPYGGAETADYAQYFLPFSRLLRDIGPSSWPMRRANKIEIHHPWTNIVTVKGGAAWILGANDGIVTVNSQRYHGHDMELIDVNYNHYEVVLSEQVIDIIKERINMHTSQKYENT